MKNNKGFTVLELVVVISLIGVLLLIGSINGKAFVDSVSDYTEYKVLDSLEDTIYYYTTTSEYNINSLKSDKKEIESLCEKLSETIPSIKYNPSLKIDSKPNEDLLESFNIIYENNKFTIIYYKSDKLYTRELSL